MRKCLACGATEDACGVDDQGRLFVHHIRAQDARAEALADAAGLRDEWEKIVADTDIGTGGKIDAVATQAQRVSG